MSFHLIQWAALAAVPSVYEKAVLLVLAQAANSETAQTWIGQETIANRARVSVRKVVEVMATLEAMGLLKRSRRFLDNGNRTSDMITLSPSAQRACGEEPSAPCAGGPSAPHVVDQVHAVQGNPKLNTKISNMSSGKLKGEQSGKARGTYPDEFDTLWKAYPHYPGRSNKGASHKAWERLSAEGRAALAGAVTAFSQTPQAAKDGGQFVKGLHLWIRDDLWRDFIPEPSVADQSEAIDWDWRLTSYRENRTWLSSWGEKPGRDGCIVPVEVLSRHGLGRPPAPSLKIISGGMA